MSAEGYEVLSSRELFGHALLVAAVGTSSEHPPGRQTKQAKPRGTIMAMDNGLLRNRCERERSSPLAAALRERVRSRS
jgi:hypothetical protein